VARQHRRRAVTPPGRLSISLPPHRQRPSPASADRVDSAAMKLRVLRAWAQV